MQRHPALVMPEDLQEVAAAIIEVYEGATYARFGCIWSSLVCPNKCTKSHHFVVYLVVDWLQVVFHLTYKKFTKKVIGTDQDFS